MMKLKFALALLVASAIVSSCGGSSTPASEIDAAELEFESQRYAAAQKLADHLVLSDSFGRLSVDELCRLSLLTAQLADISDEDANMALASRCMGAALKREPDSVMNFLHTLPADMQSRFLFVRQLARALDPECAPGEIIDNYNVLPGDSLSVE